MSRHKLSKTFRCLNTIAKPNVARPAPRSNLPLFRLPQPQSIRFQSTSNVESFTETPEPSFWTLLIPKIFRRSRKKSEAEIKRKKEWNPATFFIVMFLLIGSNAVNMMGLRREARLYNRKADKKLSLLNEVIGRIQNGEDVDVEGLLGKGDAAKEKEWEEVLKEIEEEDRLWSSWSKKKASEKAEEPANKAVSESEIPKLNNTASDRKGSPTKSLPGFF
ncbi:MAG: hypothetical protein M1834_008056 [Cirrosporium novae-zelandiae]|nr:MAG: hypothetical protein M1834_008056 [Cirrosporium novae-zelandiae]